MSVSDPTLIKRAKRPSRNPQNMSEHDVLKSLRKNMFVENAWAWLTQVRNGTGYTRTTRYADALAVSCWPSRGIYATGIEVKVSKSDWMGELKDPRKSAEVQKYCRFWYIAAPEGIVEPCQLPETWGLLVVTSGGITEARSPVANKSAAEPSWSFFASIARNVTNTLHAEYLRGSNDGYETAEKEFSADKVREAERQMREAVAEKNRLADRLISFEKVAARFNQELGMSLSDWGLSQTIERCKLADTLLRVRPEGLIASIRQLSDAATEYEATLKP